MSSCILVLVEDTNTNEDFFDGDSDIDIDEEEVDVDMDNWNSSVPGVVGGVKRGGSGRRNAVTEAAASNGCRGGRSINATSTTKIQRPILLLRLRLRMA